MTDEAAAIPGPARAGWRSRFGGRFWRTDAGGVYTRERRLGTFAHRMEADARTARRAWAAFGDVILAAARRHGVAPQLILMAIARNAAGPELTGPATFRWQAHVAVRDVDPPVHGDHQAGPMGTSARRARAVIREAGLPYDPLVTAPVLRAKIEPPDLHPLYDPATAIDIGAADLRLGMGWHGGDPLLAAVVLELGRIAPAQRGDWRIDAPPGFIDAAAGWYGDACAVISEALPPR